MIYGFLAVFLFISFWSIAKADENNDSPKENDYEMAKRYGYSTMDVLDTYRQIKNSLDTNKIQKEIAEKLKKSDFDRANLIDTALFNIVQKAYAVLVAEGHIVLADTIKDEYETTYKMALTRGLFGTLELGDHPPMSEWLDSVHERIHDAVGDLVCKYFRFHDIYILNHGIRVIFNPKDYDLKDYKDHFAGHLIWGYFWEHHGVAGVVSYWIVNGVCIGSTWGLGLVAFVCSPIASLTEHVIDKRIAPPIAESIWKRAQKSN